MVLLSISSGFLEKGQSRQLTGQLNLSAYSLKTSAYSIGSRQAMTIKRMFEIQITTLFRQLPLFNTRLLSHQFLLLGRIDVFEM
jgi:hypothetical protein